MGLTDQPYASPDANCNRHLVSRDVTQRHDPTVPKLSQRSLLRDREDDSLPPLSCALVKGDELLVIDQQIFQGLVSVTLPNHAWIDIRARHFLWLESPPQHLWSGLFKQLRYCLDLLWVQQLCRPVSLVWSNIFATHDHSGCQGAVRFCAACQQVMNSVPSLVEVDFRISDLGLSLFCPGS